MRVFFGIDPAPDCKRAIGDWRDRFARAEGRPVPAANFHITLAFVGDIDNGGLDRLYLAVDGCQPQWQSAAASVTLDQVGFWPRPGIFWLGCSAIPASLQRLAGQLGERAVAAGARRETRSWIPHVTLYRRCKSPPPAPVQSPCIDVGYEHVTLFESCRTRQGVRYVPLAEWPLHGAH